METNYRSNISKWLPSTSSSLEKWFGDALSLMEVMKEHVHGVLLILNDAEDSGYNEKAIEMLIASLDDLIRKYRDLAGLPDSRHSVFKHKFNHLSNSLRTELNVVGKITGYLLLDVTESNREESLRIIFRLVVRYNEMLDLEQRVTNPGINVYSNDCPPMLERMRKMSVTSILQVLAKSRAEEYCHTLIDCLLANYEPDKEEKHQFPESPDVEISENSSIEIYRALTKHMTPPVVSHSTMRTEASNVESIEALVKAQTEYVDTVLDTVNAISVKLLGHFCPKEKNGRAKIKRKARRMVSDYYQQVTWGAVSSVLDHVVLWWSTEALAARHSQGAHRLKDWLHQFVQGMNRRPGPGVLDSITGQVPFQQPIKWALLPPVCPTVRPALQNLCDALGCHVTITAWDHLFRLAYVSSFECHSASRSPEFQGTDTGQKFVRVFQLLVSLSNECEIGGEWVVGAPLPELPLSEQIVVLHRLDHSVHTMRLWAVQESRLIAHTWELEIFFLLVKSDIVNSLEELSYLKLADHTDALAVDAIDVQVYVCAKMRGKIVSEINANVKLLKGTPASCVGTLATICRIVSLANMHMCLPRSNYWNKSNSSALFEPSPYVRIYLDKLLLPVLEVIEDHEISSMILKIMCEAWLDYIYLHRIKFSERGAIQLLTDFACVGTWITECPIISREARNHLLKNEVLRRCEGVGRLLLRHPGEAIAMDKKLPQRTNENDSPRSLGLQRMPAEMYVPNQEQWLELRAPKHYSLCLCTED